MANAGGFAWDEPFKAAANLSSKQYYAVEVTAADTVNVCNAATDVVIGVLQNKPEAAGHAARVRVFGKTQAITDGSSVNIAAGDWLGTNATGKLVKKATADYGVCAIANGASTADGTIIEVYLLGPGFFRTAGG